MRNPLLGGLVAVVAILVTTKLFGWQPEDLLPQPTAPTDPSLTAALAAVSGGIVTTAIKDERFGDITIRTDPMFGLVIERKCQTNQSLGQTNEPPDSETWQLVSPTLAHTDQDCNGREGWKVLGTENTPLNRAIVRYWRALAAENKPKGANIN